MRGNPGGWKKLASVFVLMERVRFVELGMAAAAVAELERAVEWEMSLCDDQRRSARRALLMGDGFERAIAERAVEFAGARIAGLEELKPMREHQHQAAAAAHVESRLAAEQMGGVLERLVKTKMKVQTRRDQAASDDRFAGQAWLRRAAKS